MDYIRKNELINVNVEIIFDLINDVDNYDTFLPWCSESRIISHDENVVEAEINISKNFLKWKFSTKNKYFHNNRINLELLDGPFSHLTGYWLFKIIDTNNTSVELYLEYEFDNKLIELSIKPIFSNIMTSILDSFISQAFQLKNND